MYGRRCYIIGTLVSFRKIFFLLFFEEKFKGPNSFTIFFLSYIFFIKKKGGNPHYLLIKEEKTLSGFWEFLKRKDLRRIGNFWFVCFKQFRRYSCKKIDFIISAALNLEPPSKENLGITHLPKCINFIAVSVIMWAQCIFSLKNKNTLWNVLFYLKDILLQLS